MCISSLFFAYILSTEIFLHNINIILFCFLLCAQMKKTIVTAQLQGNENIKKCVRTAPALVCDDVNTELLYLLQ